MSGKTALLLGASGETGKEVLNYLVKTDVFTKIVCVVRRNIEVPSDPSDKSWNKIEQKIVNFEDLKGDIFENVDTAFCCLGTTRGKAGKEGFIKVDYDYVLNSAKHLKHCNCNAFHLLTSKGSNKNSWFLYPQTKGQVEEAVKQLGFDNMTVYRPGVLLCDRAESRNGEKIVR